MNTTAYIGNKGNYSIFEYGNRVIKFRTSPLLEKYVNVNLWDNGYMEVMVKYSNQNEVTEDYIDLSPILENLYIPAESFLPNIKNVKIKEYDYKY